MERKKKACTIEMQTTPGEEHRGKQTMETEG
jgi:hypothetical protein